MGWCSRICKHDGEDGEGGAHDQCDGEREAALLGFILSWFLSGCAVVGLLTHSAYSIYPSTLVLAGVLFVMWIDGVNVRGELLAAHRRFRY